jgi:hypothetical protein
MRDWKGPGLGEVPGELVHGRLRRRVGVGLEGRHLDAVDRADVDHPRRRLGRARLLQERQQELGDVEDALDVDVEHAVPGLAVLLGEGDAPVRASVVHQDVEAVPPLGHRLPERTAALFLRQVGDDVGALAALRQLVRHLLERFLLAGGDDHAHAGVDEAGRDHRADARGAAGDHGPLPRHVEEIQCRHGSTG